jgi:hypothetical protein
MAGMIFPLIFSFIPIHTQRAYNLIEIIHYFLMVLSSFGPIMVGTHKESLLALAIFLKLTTHFESISMI